MSDLKMNFDKLNKASKEVNEKWGNMMKENNPFDTISKIAKDIADRQDKEVALEFTKHICTLLKNNGVSPMIDEYKQNFVKENSVEQKYGVAITGLDFTEHDKRFRDEIMQLKSELSDVQKSADEYYNKCIDLTNQIAKLESELEFKDNMLKIKNGLCGDNGIAKINLNEMVKVKLTPLGAEIYYKQFDELNKQCGREICKPQMPQIDKDGYTEFQLWNFIELYGEHIGMCKPNVIEPLDIVYCGSGKCHSDHAE